MSQKTFATLCLYWELTISNVFSLSTSFHQKFSMHCRESTQMKDKLSQKRNQKQQWIRTNQFIGHLFSLSVCITFSEGHRALYFQKWFKCDHFLFSFWLVYHIAYFAQNATLSYALGKIQESVVDKPWISPISQTLIF